MVIFWSNFISCKFLISILFLFTELFSALFLVPTKLRKTAIIFFPDVPKILLVPFLCNSQADRKFCKLDRDCYVSALKCPSVHSRGYVIDYFSSSSLSPPLSLFAFLFSVPLPSAIYTSTHTFVLYSTLVKVISRED